MTNHNEVVLYAYTRQAGGLYVSSYANSIHFAWSPDGVDIHPLNGNRGLLFATGEISESNTIVELGVTKPQLFATEDGHIGIAAVMVDSEGDAGKTTRVALWSTSDLIHFDSLGETVLPTKSDFSIEYDESTLEYRAVAKMGETADGVKPEQLDASTWDAMSVDRAIVDIAMTHWDPVVPVRGREISEGRRLEVTYNDKSVDTFGLISREDMPPLPRMKFPLTVGYADPQISLVGDTYYLLATNDNLDDIGLFIRKSDTVEGLFAPNVTEYQILSYNEENNFCSTFWAPELHVIGGRYCILLALGPKEFNPQCHIMMLKEGGSPENTEDWETPVKVTREDGSSLAGDGISLDMTYVEAGDKAYYIWSHREGMNTPFDSGSMLEIAEVDPQTPWRLAGSPVLLSRPLFGWENTQGTVNNEGPYCLKSNGTIYVFYSVGAAISYSYALGCLSCPEDADLLDSASWTKSPAPVMTWSFGEYGPGHNSFFKDKLGDTYIAYHAEKTPWGTPRSAALRRVHFSPEGRPVLTMTEEREVPMQWWGLAYREN